MRDYHEWERKTPQLILIININTCFLLFVKWSFLMESHIFVVHLNVNCCWRNSPCNRLGSGIMISLTMPCMFNVLVLRRNDDISYKLTPDCHLLSCQSLCLKNWFPSSAWYRTLVSVAQVWTGLKTASFICTSWFGDSSLGSGFCWGRIKHHIHNQTNIFLSFVLGASTSQPHLSLNVTKRDVNSFLCLFLLHKASAGKRLCFFRLGGSLDISSWTQFY